MLTLKFRFRSKDEDIHKMLEEIADDLGGDMARTKFTGRTVTLKVSRGNPLIEDASD